MNRRSLFNTTALVLPALAVAACSSGTAGTGASAGISQAIAIAEGILNYVGPVLPLLAAFVPAASPFVPLVMTGISTASGLLNTLQTTMAAASAQPIVGQVSTAIGGILSAGDQAVALIANPQQKAQAQAILAAARGELGLLTQLATNIQTVVAPTAPTAAIVIRPGVVVPPLFARAA
jgi:hypothetical protein